MFSKNDRISGRQLAQQLMLDYMAVFLLCVPGIYTLTGTLGFWAIAGGVVLALLLIRYLPALPGWAAAPQTTAQRWASRLCALLYTAFFVTVAAYLASATAEAAARYLVPDTSRHLLYGGILLVGIFGAGNGVERKGRLAQVSFWPVFLLLSLLLCCLLPHFDRISAGLFTLQGTVTAKTALRDLYRFFSLFGVLGFLPIALYADGQPFRGRRAAAAGILLPAAMLVFTLAFARGMFGKLGYEAKSWPFPALMSAVSLPGDFIRRLDLLWLCLLSYTSLLALASAVFWGGRLLQQICSPVKKNLPPDGDGMQEAAAMPDGGGMQEAAAMPDGQNLRKADGRRGGAGSGGGQWPSPCSWAVGIAAFVLGCLPLWREDPQAAFLWMNTWIYTPFFLLAAAGMWLSQHRKAAPVLLAVSLLLLSGCGITEPEDREYPLAISLDEQDGVYAMLCASPDLAAVTGQDKETANADEEEEPEAFPGRNLTEILQTYRLRRDKKLDLGHVKAILFSTRLLKNEKAAKSLLDDLEQQELVAGSVPVLSCGSPKKLMALNGGKLDSLGDYLIGLLKQNGQKKSCPDLNRLYAGYHEYDRIEKVPEVEEADGAVRMAGT